MPRVALVLALSLSAGLAHAQPADRPESETMARALRLFAVRRYEDARPSFEAVALGRTGDTTARRQRAELYLARVGLHLGRFSEALGALERITAAGPAHASYPGAFGALLDLHERAPPSLEPRIIAAIGHYEDREVDRFERPRRRETFATACYLLGRARMEQRRYFDALHLFERVPEDTRVGASAQEWRHRALATVGPL